MHSLKIVELNQWPRVIHLSTSLGIGVLALLLVLLALGSKQIHAMMQ